jgi:hypothetical protein
MISSMSIVDLAFSSYVTDRQNRTLVGRNAAGMHAYGSPQAPDLMVFSPARSLVNFDETVASPAHSPVDHEARAESQPLQYHTSGISSPLLNVSNAEAVPSLKNSSEDVPSAKSSVTERDFSPFVRTTPPAATITTVNEDQNAQMDKRVRFDLSAQTENSTPCDSGSEDPLALNATLRKKLQGKQTKKISTANKERPLPTGDRRSSERRAIEKSLRRKPAGILDQFKNGRLNSDSDDEEQAPVQIQSQTPVSDS